MTSHRTACLALLLALGCSKSAGDAAEESAPEPRKEAPSEAEPEPVSDDAPESEVTSETGAPEAGGDVAIELTDVDPGALPAAAKVTGKVERSVSWRDRNGVNYGIFTSRETRQRDMSSRWLYVYHYAGEEGSLRLVREVRDLVSDCDLDLLAEFDPRALAVTDLDEDGIGELTFAYRVVCRSDVSPATLKLLVLEGGDKYILRGEERIDFGPDEKYGGDFKPDPGKAKWPASHLAHAERTWARVVESSP